MLQNKNPGDYVLATNTGYSVREFLKFSFDAVNLKRRNMWNMTKDMSVPLRLMP